MRSGKEGQHAPASNAHKYLIGGVTGALIIIGLQHVDILHVEAMTTFLIGFFFAIFLIFILLIIAFFLFQEKFLKKIYGKNVDFSSALSVTQNSVKVFIVWLIDKSLHGVDEGQKDKLKAALPIVANHVLFASLRSWVFRYVFMILGLVGGLLGTILLFNQNELLKKQNEKIDMQIHLEDASRRSSLIFLMSNILDEIDEELDNPENGRRSLSSQLIGRIASLSQSFTQYKYLEIGGDTLIHSPLSPERGQLLLAIINSDLDTFTLDKIYRRTFFRHADLRGAYLDGAYLKGARLENANLEETHLDGAKLIGAHLDGVNLNLSNIDGADMSKVYMRKAIVTKSDLNSVLFKGAKLDGTNFNGSDFSKAQFENAFDQLINVKSLASCKGLPDSISYLLKKNKSELFSISSN